ncbi:CotD family spore coat protein [Bacillus carboniphilus]|uniref:CotD family spore coat protein n=1 Tax=Bacillus carboniphilus TaxID=86663 RepID=A0ABY9JUF2_9BACI|nr:CotD family spore coat protein [Bacillus carboniphilus]WLR43024.1 CotD family spore coat protein [Bacillus carboniphilus]
MNCRPKVCKPIVYPTQCCENHNFQKTIVPHIHPSHTTNVNHEMYEHIHYYPHSESAVNEVNYQNFNATGPVPYPYGPTNNY